MLETHKMQQLLADRFLLHTPLKKVTMRTRSLAVSGCGGERHSDEDKRKGKDGTGNGMLILPALTT